MRISHAICALSLLLQFGNDHSRASELTLSVISTKGEVLPCRIHLTDSSGKAYFPPRAPFWRGGFVCEGTAKLVLSPGSYGYEVERGPEWFSKSGTIEIEEGPTNAKITLERIADLKKEGWFAGDLHVHRTPNEIPLHLRAEDLSIASVQSWWNKRNAWGDLVPPKPIKQIDGRYYHILSGEDERGGGALLYHRMAKPIEITFAEREWPSSTRFLDEAIAAGGWAEIEKPFWWDTPLWLATGKISSIGIAQNHMQRRGVLGTEAWGRPRDLKSFPGVHGNGIYTQDLYYKILNTGLRIPPSAGSASGVLANPVGYNRVYVHTGADMSWDTWWDGLRNGHSFVTNGPLLRLKANDKTPGSVLKSDRPLKVQIEGRIDSQDPIRIVELVRNGSVIKTTLPTEFTFDKSGWFLVRAIAEIDETFRFASTAPWYVEIGNKPMVPSQDAADYFLRWARERKTNIEHALTDIKKRIEVSAEHAKAIDYWEKVKAVSEDKGAP